MKESCLTGRAGECGPVGGEGNKAFPGIPRPRFLPVVITLIMTLAFFQPAVAVVTFDILHDTPKTREFLQEEIGMESATSWGAADSGETATFDDFEAIWFAREKFLQIGEKEKARAQLQLLWEKKMERGVRNLPEYGAVLIREARRKIRNGSLDEAEELVAMARNLAPEYLPVYFASASIVFKKSFVNIAGLLSELTEGVRAIQRSFRLQSWLLVNAYFLMLFSLGVFFTISILIMVFGNARMVVHEIGEALPSLLTSRLNAVVAWMLFLAPAIVGLPLWWWLIIWGIAVLPFVSRFARLHLFTALLVLFALPWLVDLGAVLLTIYNRPLLEKVVLVREGHWKSEDYTALQEMAMEMTSDSLAQSVLGLAAKRQGLFDEAEIAYQEALKLSPNAVAVWNNFGNLALAGKNTEEAIKRYNKAIEIAPERFAPHYNLSLAYREKLAFGKGEEESRRAAAIDPDANAYYAGIAGPHFNRYTVDELPPIKLVWSLAFSENNSVSDAGEHLWGSLMLGTSRKAWPYVLGVVLILGVGLTVFRTSRGKARACTRCGRVYCPRCHGKSTDALCSQCHHIFVLKAGVDAKVRVNKLAGIQKMSQFRRIRNLVFAALLPGGGHMASGNFGIGLFFFLPASVFIAKIYRGEEYFPSAWHLNESFSAGFFTFVVIGYVIWWGLSLWLTFRMEE